MPHPQPVPGLYHTYSTSPLLTAFEHTHPTTSSPSSPPKKAVLYIAGLYDGPLTVAYTVPLAAALYTAGWSFVELRITSSFHGWGEPGASVGRDAKEIRSCVVYFRELGLEKIVLLGHSTGCQDLIAYMHLYSNDPLIEGTILQAPVSDREYLIHQSPPLPTSFPPSTPRDSLIPSHMSDVFGPARICVKRWESLIQKGGGELRLEENEDFFSTDLSEERVKNVWNPFRPSGKKLLVLLSEKDETYPEALITIDKLRTLLQIWSSAVGTEVWSDQSTILEGNQAVHVPSGEPLRKMESAIAKFLAGLKE